VLFFLPQSFRAPSFLLFFGCVLFRLLSVTSVFLNRPYPLLSFQEPKSLFFKIIIIMPGLGARSR
jgi:hypothetical protein